ncbi:dephospho-CoA kinase [Aurantiacibacter hainanensis]|uniref:dephospho-CoA kinase n=1 Tax=Aurantiacibacter hainanensis TaxID=3076114 RepID=UPI0030C6C371
MTNRLPHIIGLTGSIAMGKSTVAAMFEDAGVPVFDADAEVRRMQGPGGILLAEIEEAFPGSTGPDGVLREELGEIVFGDADKLARLETIVHPAVTRARERFLKKNADKPLVLFDIPLLFEKGAAGLVDTVVVVSAPAEVQRQRVLARKGMTEQKFTRIMEHQLPDAAKRERADHVIDTGTPMDETRAQVEALVDKLKADLRD